MKKTTFKMMLLTAGCAVITFAGGCMEKDLYEQVEPKTSDQVFDFSTRSEVALNINYGLPGYRALFSVYAENPMTENGYELKEGVEALFSAFTGEDNTYVGKIYNLPSSTEKVYLYSYYYGLPTCVELDVVGGQIVFDNAAITTRAEEVGHLGVCAKIGANKSTINASKKLYALYDGIDGNFSPVNSNVAGLYKTIDANANISSTSTATTIGALLGRIRLAVGTSKKDNTGYISEASKTNTAISKQTTDGKDVTDAHIDLVFLNSNPGYYVNSLGYYYYKSDAVLSAQMIKELPKFMVFPKMIAGKPTVGRSVRIQFFGENYDGEGTDDFPSGYTIGWCLIANVGTSTTIAGANSNINNSLLRAVYSNFYAENQVRPGFIALYDEISGKMVLGIEDTAHQKLGISPSDNSYEDLLFYVDADPIGAIVDPENPGVPIIVDDEEIESTEKTSGTLAFEDIWPNGGDYDMNDVVMAYTSVVTFNQFNEIKKVVDTFTPIHDGADYKSAFGYIINSPVGAIVAESSNYLVKEEDNQIVLFGNAKSVQNQNFTLTRVFEKGSYPLKTTYKREYNPFIVVNYVQGEKDRTEVHLPKYPATLWANAIQVGSTENAFYVDKDGKYPFAIDLPTISFQVPVERTVISTAYPQFDLWVNSNGATHTNWYMNPSAADVQ